MRFVASAAGIVALIVLAIAHAVQTPAVLPADAPRSEFSAERAMEHVRQLARAPRPTGSEGHEQALIYVMARIAALGLEPRIQGTTGIGTRYQVAGRVRNIVARVPGMRPAGPEGGSAVLLMAHYDGVAAAPAAGDDASGVAVLLETLRAIRNGPLLANDVIALFTDSEEAGLLGAAAFAREHAWAKDVGVILNFEARGTRGPSLMFETGPGNHDVVRFLRTVPGARATSLSTAVYRQLPNDTDLSELAVLERPAMNFAFIGGVERYHTSEDDVRHLSPRSLQHHGHQALALTRAFGNARLPRPAGGDGVFFDLPLAGIVLYPVSWAMPFAVLTFVLATALLVLVARRDGAAYAAAALGMVTMMISVILAAIVAAGTATLVARIHASVPWGGSPEWRGIYALAMALLAVAVVSAAFAVARRTYGDRWGRRPMVVGALLALAAVSIYVTAVMPGASFLFTWPVLAAVVAAIATKAAGRVVHLVVRWLAAAIIILVLAPTAYLMVCMALGVDLTGGAVLAGLTAFGVWLLAAPFDDLAMNRWRLPATTAAAAVLLLAVGVFTARTNAKNPAGSTMAYVVDSATNQAWLAGAATNAWARTWLERALREVGAGRQQASAPAWLTRSYAPRRIVVAPVVPLSAPTATVEHDSLGADARLVTLRVRASGARSVQLSAEAGVVSGARVDDREVRTERYRGRSPRWTLEYVAPPADGFTVTLALQPGADHRISLIGRHGGIPPDISVPQRPPGVLAIGSGDATHVYRELSLRSSVGPAH